MGDEASNKLSPAPAWAAISSCGLVLGPVLGLRSTARYVVQILENNTIQLASSHLLDTSNMSIGTLYLAYPEQSKGLRVCRFPRDESHELGDDSYARYS